MLPGCGAGPLSHYAHGIGCALLPPANRQPLLFYKEGVPFGAGVAPEAAQPFKIGVAIDDGLLQKFGAGGNAPKIFARTSTTTSIKGLIAK